MKINIRKLILEGVPPVAIAVTVVGFFFLGVDAYYMAKLHHDYTYAVMTVGGFIAFIAILNRWLLRR